MCPVTDLHSSGDASWLTPQERLQGHRFRSPKRYREWRAGRLAAKQSVKQLLERRGENPGLADIEIAYDSNGAPFLPARADVLLSVSHSAHLAAAAAAKIRIGIDLEQVPDTAPGIARPLFFTPREMRVANNGRENEKTLKTLIFWTRKEAVAKLLGVGGKIAFNKIDALSSRFRIYSSVADRYCFSMAMPDRRRK